ncbi:helix-turn-helix domain-containing protein [Azospirillum rugosum]|uniref:AraC-like DNA-binding protein n=1 Tax=Azospirillum rugosum TaxID=416170 RepID=A0ABS4SWV9_9PROT|nr:helix-turn-helix domain-containing protein [Azospirillum rugosum]MBP2297039.1 AraC-like DNA-binding protein [Azospirillum rugosum]MDQ0530833.1 AraC-like DNA-binding protein [Azospirillum rugosum]
MTITAAPAAEVETHFELRQHVVSVNLADAACDIAVGSGAFQSVLIPRGGLCFYPAGTRVRLTARAGAPYVAVALDPHRFDAVLLEEAGVAARPGPPLLGHVDPAARAIGEVAAEGLLGVPPSATALEACATLLVLHAARAAFGPLPVPERGLSPADLRRAVAFVEAHLAEADLDALVLAAALDLPVERVHQGWREALGITPAQYIFERRLANAKALLDQGEPPQEAAVRSGLGSPERLAFLLRASRSGAVRSGRRAAGQR